MAIVMDFEFLKEEVGRTVEELKSVTASIDPLLLDDLQTEDNQENTLPQGLVRARLRDLMVAQTKLSRALYRTQEQWDLMVQSVSHVEQEDRHRALYDEARLHWNDQGGDQAQRAARDFLDRIEVALLLLEPHLQQKGTCQIGTPAAPPQRRVPLTTPVRTALRTRPEDASLRGVVQGTITHQVPLPARQAASEDELHPEQREALPLGTPGSPICALPQEQFVRLPKFDLPPFLGEIEQFPSFWDAFNSAVHANPTLSPVVKFHHLKNLLQGDARAIVAGYDITAENYELAVHTLCETYYRPQLIRTQLSTRLQNMKCAGTSALHQRITLAQIKSLWLQLQKLGDHEDNIFVMRLIRQKFPQRTLEHLGSIETADPTPWKVSQLLNGLDRAIKTFETIADTMDMRSAAEVLSAQYESSPTKEFSCACCISRRRVRFPAREPHVSSTLCAFCRRAGHFAADCSLVTSRQARLTIVVEEGLCRKCFDEGHLANECDSPSCSFCQKDHHPTLCRWQFTSAQSRSGNASASRTKASCPPEKAVTKRLVGRSRSLSPGRKSPSAKTSSLVGLVQVVSSPHEESQVGSSDDEGYDLV